MYQYIIFWTQKSVTLHLIDFVSIIVAPVEFVFHYKILFYPSRFQFGTRPRQESHQIEPRGTTYKIKMVHANLKQNSHRSNK
jgi:hypothetical protein